MCLTRWFQIYSDGNVVWKWRRLTSNEVIRRFMSSIYVERQMVTSTDVIRLDGSDMKFSTIFVEVVENCQFLTIFDDLKIFKNFQKISRLFSTKIDEILHLNDVNRRHLTSIYGTLRRSTSIVKWRRIKNHFTSMIDEYYWISSILSKCNFKAGYATANEVLILFKKYKNFTPF